MVIAKYDLAKNKFNINKKLYQYDYGQVLRIEGILLPTAIEIDFSLHESGGKSESNVGVTKDGVTDVRIPDVMLENKGVLSDYFIYAFIYLTDETSGQTVYKIRMSVIARPERTDYSTPDPSHENMFQETITAVNEAADRAEEAGKSAEAAREESQEIVDGIRTDVQGWVDQTTQAKNIAIENANISTNNAEETELDRVETENNKNIAGVYMQQAIEASNKSEEALNQFLSTLASQPKRYYRLSVEEMNAIENPNPDDLCYVIDLANSRTAIYFYDAQDVDGDEVNPEWQFLGNAEFAQMDKLTLLKILDLAAVAITGDYNDLLNIPKRYNTPVVLDGTGEIVAWDYSQSDTAVVTLTADKAISISNPYNGCIACIQCYGAQLDFSDETLYRKSATFDYIEPLEAEHIMYTLIYNAGKWDVTAMVYAGGEASA